MNSLPRFTTVLVLGSAPFAHLDTYGFEPDPLVSGVLVVLVGLVFWVWFGVLVLIVRLILRTPHLNSTR